MNTKQRVLVLLLVAAVAVTTWVAVRAWSGVDGASSSSPDSSMVRTVTAGHPDLANDPKAPLAVGLKEPEPADALAWSESVGLWSDDEPTAAFGVFVCLQQSGPIKLISVEPVDTKGTDFKTFGAWVYTPGAGENLKLSVGGDPSRNFEPAALAPLPNAPFEYECGNPEPQQLLVGLQATGPSGGGWDGIRLTYEAKGGRHTLEAPVQAFLCGAATISCEPPD